IINGFTYDHSEKLGDAFEYLLSVLGSQGDAGQFRTPRHIIDFIVEILQPKKNETVCDPACGTAGFLISSYKYILKNNSKHTPNPSQEGNYRGDLLTPDDRKKLMQNFTGYDISPDMVRLSLVNMYLHGFTTPKIYEYDTLTSEDRWNEYFDVILANPPFMSPKGGIKPHKKFTIQANRSEVLFVDYIAEHIHPSTGRAGIIVPEGIIFQSATAYKTLRKILVDKNYLFAVVSLPAGIFQPYSGVKTSILLMDKTLAKKTDKILFVKIENEGFDLGAQRREIDKNDLPDALKLLQQYKQNLQNNTVFTSNNKNVFLVDKMRIAAKEEYNLSVDHYRVNENVQQSNFEMVSVEDLIEDVKYTTKIQKSEFLENGKYPIIDQSENFIAGYWNNENDLFKIEKPVVVFGDHTRIFKYVDFDFVLGADGVKILLPNENVNSKFFYYYLKNTKIKNLGYSRHWKELKEKQIPLPPLSIQRQIVNKIESFQKIIDGAKQVVENYKPQIEIDASWEMVELGSICENLDSKRKPVTSSDRKQGKYPYYGASGIVDYVDDYIFDDDYLLISEDGANLLARVTPIAFSVKGKIWVNNHAHILKFKKKATQSFVELYLNSINLEIHITGSAQPKLNQANLNGIPIPLPSIEEQTKIVTQIEKEQQLVNK
ncbi:MAG: N-6 DNA methylase, partial [Bacteroidia bacterium]|nr:N-6 DNA methylase [Bacteroidia bacterium]